MRHKIAVSFIVIFANLSQAFARFDRPIEILSDPYKVGNPTKYTILRGTTEVTFSHPLAGQFTRAEVKTREKTGHVLTRFLISPDGKRYQPTLRMEMPFEVHNYSQTGQKCLSDEIQPGSIDAAVRIAPALDDGATIAVQRNTLEKHGFFHESCSTIAKEHRDAIFNATADVLTLETPDAPEPRFLTCLNQFGYEDVSKKIQAMVFKSLATEEQKPRLTLMCVGKTGKKSAQFDEETNTLSLRTMPKADRTYYATKIFHELLHTRPMRDSAELSTIETCCTRGLNCNDLKSLSASNRDGQRQITIANSSVPESNVASGVLTVLNGDAAEAGRFSQNLSQNNSVFPLSKESPTYGCKQIGAILCNSLNKGTLEQVNATLACPIPKPKRRTDSVFLETLWVPAFADDKNCSSGNGGGTYGTNSTVIEDLVNMAHDGGNSSLRQLSNQLPQNSPLDFDQPQPASRVEIQFAQNSASDLGYGLTTSEPASRTESVPSRGIASIELPETSNSRMGSIANRRDISPSRVARANSIVDTLENAAIKVANRMTPVQLENLKVNTDDFFKKGYSANVKDPHYMVASFAADSSNPLAKPLMVAQIGSKVADSLSFKNPFAATLPNPQVKTNASGKQPTEGNSRSLDQWATLPTSAGGSGDTANAFSPSVSAKSAKAEGPSNVSPASNTAGKTAGNTKANSSGATAVATEPDKNNRAPSSIKNTPDFKKMDRKLLVQFITSHYQSIEDELSNKDLETALSNNKLRIYNRENRAIGAKNPQATFVFDPARGRLVQKRLDRVGK